MCCPSNPPNSVYAETVNQAVWRRVHQEMASRQNKGSLSSTHWWVLPHGDEIEKELRNYSRAEWNKREGVKLKVVIKDELVGVPKASLELEVQPVLHAQSSRAGSSTGSGNLKTTTDLQRPPPKRRRMNEPDSRQPSMLAFINSA